MKRLVLLLMLVSGIAGLSQARDSLGMRLIGQTLLGPARQVVVQGNYTYVGVSCGLLILDVSDPANPVEMGRAYISTRIEDIFIQSGYAYVVDALEGLAVVDVRDVRNPRVVGKANFGFNMFGVAVKDTLAYVVGSGGMQDSSDFFVINVKDPAAPFVVAGYDTCWGEKIQIVDTLAYVPGGGWQPGIEIWNVRDPLSVHKVGRYLGIGTTRDVQILDTLCYAVSQDSGLVILNIRDPLNPQKLGRCKPNGGPMRVSLLGTYAYLCEDLNVYSDYPMRNLSRFWAIDITDPTNPIQVGWYESPGSGGDVFAIDSLVYFADGGKGLRVMDVSNPTLPREITHYPTGDVCWELVKQGNYLYVAHGGDGLRVLDVSNPAQPVEVGHLEMPWRTFDIILKDSLLYAAEGDSGLVVVDIRNPAQPQIIGRWPLSLNQMAYGIFVLDTLVYLSGQYAGNLWIVNVADPRNPYYLGSWGTPSSAVYDLWVRGRYAYLPDWFPPWTFHVIDVGDPRRPNEVYPWTMPPGGRDVEFADTLGYILVDYGTRDGLYIVSVANPVRPDTAGGYVRSTGEDALYGLHYFAPGYVWVGGRTYYYQTVEYCGRVDLVDVRNPHPAQSIRHYETGWTISDVWGEDFHYAYGGAYLGNLLVFGVDSIVSGVGQEAIRSKRTGTFELSVTPNPVRAGCRIRLGPVAFGPVRLSIYDVAGRAIKVFPPHASRLTPYEFVWDGRDDQGKEVRSGVYFLRAELGERSITKKVVVVR